MKCREFKGVIIEDSEMIGFGTFKIFVEMNDGTKCYHRKEDNEDERVWYSRKNVTCPDGTKLNLFFIEGFDGNEEEYTEYKKTLKTL